MSSATPTDKARPAGNEDADLPRATATAPGSGRIEAPVTHLTTLALTGVGWLGILYLNRWNFGVPVFFLFVGWLSVVLLARYLWTAGMSAALDSEGDEDFWKPLGRRQELMMEKRSLLKAIKEIEFDHEMGKMSDEDAAQMSRLYRARAIEVIKALEGALDEDDASIAERIESDVKARLTVASATNKAGAAASKKKKKDKSEKRGAEAGASPAEDGVADAPAGAPDGDESPGDSGAAAKEAESARSPGDGQAPEPASQQPAAERAQDPERKSAEVGS